MGFFFKKKRKKESEAESKKQTAWQVKKWNIISVLKEMQIRVEGEWFPPMLNKYNYNMLRRLK
jgi:hypothetical protein